jgi:type I restriction enzyme S subunit
MVRLRWEVDFKDSEIGMLKTDGSAHYIFAHGVCGRIPKDWKIKRIDDEYKVNTGERVSPDSEGLFPVYGANGFSGYSKNFLIEKEAIITGRVGTIGQVFRVKGKVNISDNALYITKRNEESVIDFLYYALKLIFSNIEEVLNVGTTQPLIKQSEVQKFSIHFPEREEQERIASVLSWFDDLIENKKRQNAVLEKTAMAIFKSWFIDFEPFEDEEFINCDIRKMPKTWETKKIKEVGEVGGGSTPSTKNKEYWNGEVAWITPKDLADRYTDNFVYISKGERNITKKAVEECSLRLFPPNTVLLTSRAPIGYVAIAENYLTTNQGFKNIIPKDPVYCEFIYCFLKYNVEYLRDIAGGSTFSEITAETLKEVELIIPPTPILLRFHKLVNSLFQKILLNQKEIMVLRRVRDVLLPLIVFGRLRVEEI